MEPHPNPKGELLTLALWGLGVGLALALVAAVAAALGASGGGQRGLLRALDTASLVGVVLAGALVMGSGKRQQVDALNGQPVPAQYPWGTLLVLLIGGAVCALLRVLIGWWG